MCRKGENVGTAHFKPRNSLRGRSERLQRTLCLSNSTRQITTWKQHDTVKWVFSGGFRLIVQLSGPRHHSYAARSFVLARYWLRAEQQSRDGEHGSSSDQLFVCFSASWYSFWTIGCYSSSVYVSVVYIYWLFLVLCSDVQRCFILNSLTLTFTSV